MCFKVAQRNVMDVVGSLVRSIREAGPQVSGDLKKRMSGRARVSERDPEWENDFRGRKGGELG